MVVVAVVDDCGVGELAALEARVWVMARRVVVERAQRAVGLQTQHYTISQIKKQNKYVQ